MKTISITKFFLQIVLCISCCASHRYVLPRHFFIDNYQEHLVLYDESNSTNPLTFDIRLRYVLGQDRLIIADSSSPKKILYKIICQNKDYCHILGWTRNRTNVTVLATLNTMAWYPYPTKTDPEFYIEEERNETNDKIKSTALLQQPLLISSELFDDVLNVTFFPLQRKYTIAYGTGDIVVDINHFDRSTPYDDKIVYFLQIVEDVNSKIDPAFLISICISIDYMEWPYYFSSSYSIYF
ncbi:hypothetical protein I4U23_011195 [Adineta vaga]|nr:hypothetical protein I4U23_011195 [Adineta vaga]